MGFTLRRAVIAGIVASLILAVFINYPPPELSDRLKSWQSRGQRFSFEGHKIFYIDERGTGEGTVVCLHGFPTFSYDWIKVLDGLKKRFGRVIAADFIGYGFSDKPLDHNYSVFEQADMIEVLLLQLGVERVHVLSHDFGDTVALELLTRNSADPKVRLETLCMLNGGIFKDTNFPSLGQKALVIPYLGSVLTRFTSFVVFKHGFGRVFGIVPSQEEMEDFWAATRYNDGHLITHKLLGYIEERSKNQGRWEGVLKVAQIPVHVIYGPADPVNPPAFAKHYSLNVPKPSITVLSPDVGHYPQFEKPQAVLQDYNRFLDATRAQKE